MGKKKGIGLVLLAIAFALGITIALSITFILSSTKNTIRVIDDTKLSQSIDQIDFFHNFLYQAVTFSTYQGFFNVGEGGGYRYSFAPNPPDNFNAYWYNDSTFQYPTYDDYKASIIQSIQDFFKSYVNDFHNNLDSRFWVLGGINFNPNSMSVEVKYQDENSINVTYTGDSITYNQDNQLSISADKDFTIYPRVPDFDRRYNINKMFVDNYVDESTPSPDYDNPSVRLHEKIKKCIFANTGFNTNVVNCDTCSTTPPDLTPYINSDNASLRNCIQQATEGSDSTESAINSNSDVTTYNYNFDLEVEKLETKVTASCTYTGCTGLSSCCNYLSSYDERSTPNPINAWETTYGTFTSCSNSDGGWNAVNNYCKNDLNYPLGAVSSGSNPCKFQHVNQRYFWNGEPTPDEPPYTPDGSGLVKVKCETLACNKWDHRSDFSCEYTRYANVTVSVKSEKLDSNNALKDQSYPVYSYPEGTTKFRHMYMKYLLFFREP